MKTERYWEVIGCHWHGLMGCRSLGSSKFTGCARHRNSLARNGNARRTAARWRA